MATGGAALSVSTPAALAARPGHDIIVMMGQSNALGAGLGPADYPDPDMPSRLLQAYEPTKGNILVQACTGQLLSSYGEREGKPSGTGPAEALLRRLAAAGALEPKRKAIVVNGSIGGSSILQWGPKADIRFGTEGDLYLRTLRRVRWAMRNLDGDNRIVGIVIQNGETEIFWRDFAPRDFRALTPAQYRNAMISLISRIRADLGGAFPVSIGEPVGTWLVTSPARWSIIAEIRAIPRALGRVRLAASTGLQSNKDASASATDDIHYSAQSAITLGRRHADNVMTIGRY